MTLYAQMMMFLNVFIYIDFIIYKFLNALNNIIISINEK